MAFEDSTFAQQTSISQRKGSSFRRVLRWMGRSLLLLAGLFLLLFVYNQIASVSAARRFPAPGEMVDVGGHAMHLTCIGQGSPTVLVEAGSGSWSLDWRSVQEQMAEITRVCTYDRAGYGWSEAGPRPRTAKQIANELHGLVTKADIERPFILLAHSFGGLPARVYADEYTDDLAGLVLLDTRTATFSANRPAEMAAVEEAMQTQQAVWGSLLTQTGLIRLLGPILAPPPAGLPESLHPIFRAQLNQPKFLQAVSAEGAMLAQSEQQASKTGPMGNLPLVVVTHDPQHMLEMPGLSAQVNQEADMAWQEAQRQLLSLSTDSKLVVASGSGHNIYLERPALLAEIIYNLVGRFHSGPAS
ncbi:MAG: alpha/beta hydrolase [Caldilineaceae bacterium]|nr:alpha/beta hydrolase [Caldilineaceae bacterium]